MATYTQSERPLEIVTDLGKDALLLRKFEGRERISEPFRFDLEMFAELRTEIRFEKLLGHGVTIRLELANHSNRFFHGIVKRLVQADSDTRGFRSYKAEVVPALWLLKKKVQSRIFQRLPVPEILRQVLTGFDITFRLTATYPKRDYVVQYRESDFQFASRLMEEEGIWYFFEHKHGSHRMIVSDRFKQPVEGQSTILYKNPNHDELHIFNWAKAQELSSTEVTLWDHTFELPGKHLETSATIADFIKAGSVTHPLRIAATHDLKVYDYPGGYAQRFDGVDSNGGQQDEDIRNIFADRDRSIQLRVQQEESTCLDISAESNCGNFSAGQTFFLKRHFDADGEYLLTDVDHKAILYSHETGDDNENFEYANVSHCIPGAVNFRPQPVTPKPVISGLQTATVVGPSGEEIFVDKYGRIKVQFHWDREGQRDAKSSCWIRVSQFWAGNRWGAFFWPRIGHEVVVAYEEGDPDQPLVVGSVYNADNMPFYELPFFKDFAGIKSSSITGNAHEHYNGVVFVDRKGKEHLAIHSERHMVFNMEFDRQIHAGRDDGERVPGAKMVTIGVLPGGGGSGGGPSDDWNAPSSTPTKGLSATIVYGTSFGTAMPLAFNTSMFSNISMRMNPIAFNSLLGSKGMTLGPLATAAFGALGNLSLGLGTDTDIMLGQKVSFGVGPAALDLGTTGIDALSTPVRILGGVIIAMNIMCQILCGNLRHDSARAHYIIYFHTPFTQIFLVALLAFQQLMAGEGATTHTAIRSLFASFDRKSPQDWVALVSFALIAGGAIFGPIIADTLVEEGLSPKDSTSPVTPRP